jgi:hypothetical protein
MMSVMHISLFAQLDDDADDEGEDVDVDNKPVCPT